MPINIKDYLDNASLEIDYSGEVTDRDAVISSVILFSAIAKADGELESEEINSLVGIVMREFEIKESEAAEIIEVALLVSEDKKKLDNFVERVNETFDQLQKQLIMTLVWRVMLADNIIEKAEASLAVKLRTAIGLSMEEAIRARKLAELDVLNIEMIKNQAE
jgi:uncharacterized tellurite resistance protein B-like protein